MKTELLPLDDEDRKLIAAATELLRVRYDADRHTVSAVVLCAGGAVHAGVNLDCSAIGPCAEPVAIGAAVCAGDKGILKVVAVCKRADRYEVLSPCGNCRQLLLDYAPEAVVILNVDGRTVKAPVRSLLPGAYSG